MARTLERLLEDLHSVVSLNAAERETRAARKRGNMVNSMSFTRDARGFDCSFHLDTGNPISARYTWRLAKLDNGRKRARLAGLLAETYDDGSRKAKQKYDQALLSFADGHAGQTVTFKPDGVIDWS